MNTRASEIIERIQVFLKTIVSLNESALIYSPGDLKALAFQEIEKFFADRKTHIIDPDIQEKEQIDKIFISSLKEGTLLIISLDKTSSPVVMRRIEQIFEDGHIPINIGDSWRKVEPVDTWQVVVWINRDDINEEEFPLRRLFVHKLVVTD